jgi:hypothetical protein
MGVCALQEVSLHKARIHCDSEPSHVGILGANTKAMNTPLTADRRGAIVAPLLTQIQRLPKVGARSAYPLVWSANDLPTATRTY